MAEELEAVIGLEIHVQLSTETKMFCGCKLSFGDDPNIHTCPICLAHPGAVSYTHLDVYKRQDLGTALQVGLGDDLDQRRTAAVEVDQGGAGGPGDARGHARRALRRAGLRRPGPLREGLQGPGGGCLLYTSRCV